MNNYFSILFFILLFSLRANNPIFAQEQNITNLIDIISADSIRKHVEFLGHGSLQGRGTGTRGERIAAQYIASNLDKYQLTPNGDQASYFQSIPMHGSFP